MRNAFIFICVFFLFFGCKKSTPYTVETFLDDKVFCEEFDSNGKLLSDFYKIDGMKQGPQNFYNSNNEVDFIVNWEKGSILLPIKDLNEERVSQRKMINISYHPEDSVSFTNDTIRAKIAFNNNKVRLLSAFICPIVPKLDCKTCYQGCIKLETDNNIIHYINKHDQAGYHQVYVLIRYVWDEKVFFRDELIINYPIHDESSLKNNIIKYDAKKLKCRIEIHD